MTLRLRRADLQYPDAGWPVSEEHLVVVHGESVIGNLRRIEGGPSNNRWSWSITALYVPPGVMTMHGMADSKDEARTAFGTTLRRWLTHVGVEDLTEDVLEKHGFGTRRR